jgi:hypothetical protein
MSEGTLALPQLETTRPINRFVKLIPGVLLLGAIGYLGKVIEQSVAAYSNEVLFVTRIERRSRR